MIVIARFSFPHEAYIAKSSLDTAGIESEIRDEHLVNMQWLYSDAIGGVKLLVDEFDAKTALQILQTDFSDAIGDELGEWDEATSDLEADIFTHDICPHCGGCHLVPYTQGKKPAFLVFLLMGFPLFFYKHGYLCEDCGEFSERLK
jgi:hypothetical protein